MAQLIDAQSAPSSTSLIDIFSVPSTQTVIDNSYWYAAHPVNTVTNDGPYQFTLPCDPDYLHLSKNYLYIKLCIAQQDGVSITAEQKVAPINLLASTLFRQVKVSLNGKVAYDSGPMYAYKAFMENELNYNRDTKQEKLGAALYSKDTSEDATNTGFIARAAQFVSSKNVEIMAPVHCDLFSVDRLMLSNTQVQLELHRNSDQFCLLSFDENANYKIVVRELIWYVKRVQLSPSVHLAIENNLMKNHAKYPVRRVATTKMHVSEGRHNVPTSSIFEGQIPRRIIIGFVPSENYFGKYSKNPFVFSPCSVTEIYVQAGGRTYPREVLKTDFGRGMYVRAYLNLIDTLGLTATNRNNYITLKDFGTRSCFFAFDLSADEPDSDNWELIREGSTTVHCTFGTTVPKHGYEMIVYAEFDNVAMIDRHRAIYFDYSI